MKYSTNDEIFRLPKHQVQNIPIQITIIKENNNKDNTTITFRSCIV